MLLPRDLRVFLSALRDRAAAGCTAPPVAPVAAGSARDPGDVLGSRALLPLDQIEFNRLTLRERLESVALDGGVVDEAVALSVRRGDEAKALGVVEPLHRSGGPHEVLLCDDGTGLHDTGRLGEMLVGIRCPPRWA